MGEDSSKARFRRKLERRADTASAELEEITRTLRRFAVFSNSGGVVSILSFIGAMLGSSGLEEFELPSSVFWILVTFLIGLLLMLLELLARKSLYSFIFDHGGSISVMGFSLRMAPAGICLSLSLVAAIVGIVSGLILLYGFTGSGA